ncbi:MAG: peptidoglycan-binding domain-containing protein [Candidatus Pedobacter colombiensis]|uniref:Peptidoglycan-binding domain-containing protein n=1 Tax=Candidatus Pedobacter colombiensis TaxID=3121371 RepID=A0AAJ5WBY1_9SPHI|nr:peptidoglycan-binding domain-containing protein [Pedobacter sp.]WEK21654.1 MAG: peptidoglycan-binding domain-containing protein [Pedobacter sp.]
MSFNKKNGVLNLAKRTLAVISASLSTLTATNAKAVELSVPVNENLSSIEELAAKKELKPQFMLRLNSNLEKSLLFMHRSHSSHSSHRSHASHSSHYSSSSSYTPPRTTTTAPTSVYTPPPTSTYAPPTTKATPKTNKRSSTIMSETKNKSNYTGTNAVSTSTLEIIGFHYRTLYKGCEGIDVEYLQKLLKEVGYETPVTGYYGEKTEKAVTKFQNENELKPDGRVNEKTHTILKEKVDGV